MHLSDRAVADPADALQVIPLVAPLQADHHREPLAFGLLVGRHQHAVAGRVDTARLFQERVLAGLHRGRVVDGPEVRRRGQEHQVHAGFHHPLIGVEPDEPPFGRHIDPLP